MRRRMDEEEVQEECDMKVVKVQGGTEEGKANYVCPVVRSFTRT